MNLRFYRSFATELMKLASGMDDAEVRRTLAKEARAFGLAAGLHDHKAKTKIDSPYQDVRDYGLAAGKGALTGAAVVGLADKLTKSPFAGHKSYRTGALIGGGLMMADRAFRHTRAGKDAKKNALVKKAGFVDPNESRPLSSPALSLSASQRTGRMKATNRLGLGKRFKPLSIGKNFRMPLRRL